jgi:uncharacterized membrane protein YfhO
VNGAEVPLLRVNFAFRGVQVGPGVNTIEITYSSPWLRTGLLVSLASLVTLILALWLFSRFGTSRRGSAVAS